MVVVLAAADHDDDDDDDVISTLTSINYLKKVAEVLFHDPIQCV